MAASVASRWIKFLRSYGPIPTNDNMYDEHIRKSAKRAGIRLLTFVHPVEKDILVQFEPERTGRRSQCCFAARRRRWRW